MNDKLTVEGTNQFYKDVKFLRKKHYSIEKLRIAIRYIVTNNHEILITKYHDHALTGDWKGYRDLHVTKNWILVYRKDESKIILVLTGTHDQVF